MCAFHCTVYFETGACLTEESNACLLVAVLVRKCIYIQKSKSCFLAASHCKNVTLSLFCFSSERDDRTALATNCDNQFSVSMCLFQNKARTLCCKYVYVSKKKSPQASDLTRKLVTGLSLTHFPCFSRGQTRHSGDSTQHLKAIIFLHKIMKGTKNFC